MTPTKRTIRGVLVWYAIGVSIAASFQAIINAIFPTSYWFEYRDIVPAKNVYEYGEPIKIETFFRIKRPFDFRAVHSAFCWDKEFGGFKFYSSQINEVPRQDVKPTEGKLFSSYFYFTSPVPLPPTECRIVSKISNGKGKSQYIVGQTFSIIE